MICPGIDLGTTYSMIAYINTHGQPAMFPDANNANSFRTPSLVYVGREGCLVGDPVDELLVEAPETPIARFVKAELNNPTFSFKDHINRTWSPEALSALILKKMLKDASVFAHEDFGPAALTVPAQFTDEQRRATLAAAELAGLKRVHLLEEPVAAAVFYGMDAVKRDSTLMVYDFGGGTFDVTILQASENGLYAIATDGEPHLGGRVIDERIMRVAATDFLARNGADPLADPGAAQRLRRLSEQAKISLSRPGSNLFNQSLLLLGKPYDFVLTREQIDKIATEFVTKTILACNRALAAADLSWRDLDAILLTGGSSLLPQVARDLQKESGKAAKDIVCRQPHQAVAFGAAIYAERMSKSGDDLDIRQATTAELALRVWSVEKNAPALETLIARNVPLPTDYVRTFYTNRSDQAQILLEFVQRRGDPPEEFTLGRFSFGPILNPERNYPVEVTVTVASDGIVGVRAKDGRTGRTMSYTLGGDGGGIRRAALDASQRSLVDLAKINV